MSVSIDHVNDNIVASGGTLKVNGSPIGGGSPQPVLTATLPGALSPFTGKPRWRPRANIVIKAVYLDIATPPTVTLVVDVLKNGVSLFPGTKPTLAAGSSSSALTGLNLAVTPADYLTIDLNTGDGSDLTCRIDYDFT